MKTFTYLGSTLAEDGELDAEVTHKVQSRWKNGKSVWSVVRQENKREDQGEGVQDSGKTGTGVRGRDIGVEEGTGKEIGGRRNGNAMRDVRSYEAGQDKK